MYSVMLTAPASSVAIVLPGCNEGDPKRELRSQDPGDQARKRQLPYGDGEVQRRAQPEPLQKLRRVDGAQRIACRGYPAAEQAQCEQQVARGDDDSTGHRRQAS